MHIKLKTVTAIALFIFVAFFAALLVLPENFLTSVTETIQNQNTPLDTQSTLNTVDRVPGVNLSLEEIAKHNSETDCYLIVNNSVYSVASFIDKHPGGRKKILDMCGGEATKIFSAIHSNFAWNLLKNYYIGNVGGTLDATKLESINNNPAIDKAISNLKGGDDEGEDEYEVEYEDD